VVDDSRSIDRQVADFAARELEIELESITLNHVLGGDLGGVRESATGVIAAPTRTPTSVAPTSSQPAVPPAFVRAGPVSVPVTTAAERDAAWSPWRMPVTWLVIVLAVAVSWAWVAGR
jgi:hypothetical protein